MRQLIGDLLESANGGQVISLAPSDPVAEAVNEMNRRNIGAVLILDAHDRLVGIFTERDVLRRVIDERLDHVSTALEAVMSANVVTLSPRATVEEALRLVDEHNCRHVPVVDGERVLGMISIRDLTSALVAARDSEIAELNDYISGG